MKPTITLFACMLVAGLASAQSPSIIQNTRATMNGVRDNATAASNAALQQSATPAQSAASTASSAPAGTIIVKATKSSGSATKTSAAKASAHKTTPVAAKTVTAKTAAAPSPTTPKTTDAASSTATPTTPEDQAAEIKATQNGRRDPFLSPVVAHTGGSGCSTGKKCLEIGDINLRGIVHSETGFIAVVSNGLNKAYFLRENDPVFNGYVVKITDDSIVFQETLQDRLGKTFTREVVKKITTPAV